MQSLRRLLAVLALLCTADPALAYDVELRWGHVTTTWQRINLVLMSVAEKVALDDEWLDKLKAVKPAAGAGRTAADVNEAIAAFRRKLDKLSTKHKVDPAPTHRPDIAPDGTLAAAYLDSGFLLDALILQVVKNDPVRVIGQYYPRFEDAKGGEAETYGLILQADERLAAIMAELGVK
ncbi:MAG: hypothetical protein H7841_07815 [Magnetospirillum sp. WYHS-4]